MAEPHGSDSLVDWRWRDMPVFTQRRGLVGAAGRLQRIFYSGGTNVDLASIPGFSALQPHKKIIVTITGLVASNNTSTPALTIGNLSSYAHVEVHLTGSGAIVGMGGAGGNGGTYPSTNPTVGGVGGNALTVSIFNDPTKLFLYNNSGTYGIAGGGGGGGGGYYGFGNLNPTKGCYGTGIESVGGSGGGGGRGGSASNGGAAGTGNVNGNAGGSGSINVQGAGSASASHTIVDASCTYRIEIINGIAGGNGGIFGGDGAGSSFAGGAGGSAILGSTYISRPVVGPVHGSVLA